MTIATQTKRSQITEQTKRDEISAGAVMDPLTEKAVAALKKAMSKEALEKEKKFLIKILGR